MDDIRFGDTLRQLRKQRNLTITELARRSGLPSNALMEWECGEAMPATDEFMKLINALQISADMLMGEVMKDEPLCIANTQPDYNSDSSYMDSAGAAAGSDSSVGSTICSSAGSGVGSSIGYSAGSGVGSSIGSSVDSVVGSHVSEAMNSDQKPCAATGHEVNHDGNDKTADSGIDNSFIEHIVSVAPFMSSEALSRIIHRVLYNAKPIDIHLIEQLAPFIDEDSLNELAINASGEPNWDMVMSIAPFAGEKTLERLIDSCVQAETLDWNHIKGLAPFLNETTLLKLLKMCSSDEEPDWASIESIAPFLPTSALDDLILNYIDSRWKS